MSSVAVFDVDGVLVDTYEIVRQAYARVGVNIYGQHWGVAWQTWLPEYCDDDLDRARALHDRKTEAHLDLLNRVTVNTLSGAKVADNLRSSGWTVRFITAGTRAVVHSTFSSVNPPWIELLAGTDLDPTGKRKALEYISPSGGVYIDDNYGLGREITKNTHWRLVHFRNQSEAMLTREITATWMQ